MQPPAVGPNEQRLRGLRVVASSFARGIVDTIAPDQIPDDAVVEALNLEYDRQHNLRTRLGCSRLNWNGNLLGDIYANLADAAWVASGVVKGNNVFDAPDAADADSLQDNSAVAVEDAEATLVGVAADGEVWGVSCYIRVPVDPLAAPAAWDEAIPAVALRFVGGTATVGGVCLIPDVTSEYSWSIRPTATYPTLRDYKIGMVEDDPVDADYRWIQVILHVANADAANVDVGVRLIPAYAAYAIAGAGFTVVTDTSGRVTADVAAQNATTGVGFWGVVLEQGRTVVRRPSTAGTAATLADNYFTGRVTSVFYYPTTSASAILATSGSKLYRFSSTNAWFASIGSLALPSDTLWQWVVFDGEAIGVNRDATGVRATGTLSCAGAANFSDGDTVTIGSTVYTFETGALDAAFKVDVGAALEDSLANLYDAINLSGTAGVTYHTDTTIHPTVRATGLTTTTLTVSAISQGTAGNAIATTDTCTDALVAWGAVTLASGAGNVNPVLLTSPSATPAGLPGLPPMGRYIQSWNGRVWIVPEDEPWTIRCSKLGDAKDWTDADASSGAATLQVDWQSGFSITGMIPFQGVMLVWTRKKIFAIIPNSGDIANIAEYRVETLHVGIGSISGYAIRTLLSDVVFMSSQGLTSLTMLDRLGALDENVLSRDVAAFGDAEVLNEHAVLENYPRKAQLLCAFAPRLGSRNSNAYTLDYRSLAQAATDGPSHPGFTRSSGPLEACSMGLADVSSQERLLLGAEPDSTTGIAYVWLYDDDDTYQDEGSRFPVSFKTKAYSWGDLFMPKRFHRWEALFELLEPDVDISITWRPDLRSSLLQRFDRTLVGQVPEGARWGSAIWGSDVWAEGEGTQNVFANGRFAGSATFGRSARALQAHVEPTSDATGLVFKGFVLAASWGRDLAPRGSGGSTAESNALITEEGDALTTGDGDTLVYE